MAEQYKLDVKLLQQTTQIQSKEMRTIISEKKVKETKPEPVSDGKGAGKQKRRGSASLQGRIRQ